LDFGFPEILAGYWQLAARLSGMQFVVFSQQLHFGLVGHGRRGIDTPPLL
jgi:hypothetical protein